MKRILFIVLLTALLLPVFGQDVSGSAGSSVIRPDTPQFNSLGNLAVVMPSSLLSFISNGIFRDEIDNVVLNPLALSQYSGYTLWTAYGNYETFNAALGNPVATTTGIAPFATVALDGTNIGNIQLGFAMPMPLIDGWRLGLLAGNQYTRTGYIDDGSGGTLSSMNTTTTVDTDVGTIAGDDTGKLGTVSYTEVTTEEAKDESLSSTFRLGAGLNMGGMAASLYAFSQTTSRQVGGSYDSTWSKGGDSYLPANETMAASALYGAKAFGKDGDGVKASAANTFWPESSQNLFGGLFQLPLQLGELVLPITGKLSFDLNSGAPVDNLPTLYSLTTAYDSDNNADKTSTYTWTGQQSIASAWLPGAPGAFTAEPTRRTDPSASGYGHFATGLGAWVDPEFKYDSPVVLKPRAGFEYGLQIEGQNLKQVAFSSASVSNPGADAAATYRYSSIREQKRSTITSLLRFDIGGIAEFKNADDTLGLALGVYYHPGMSFETARTTSDNTTSVTTYNNPAVANEATLVNSNVAYTGFEGTETVTSNTENSGYVATNTFNNLFVIPVSARIGFFKNKLVLVAGYELEHNDQRAYVKTVTDAATTGSTVVSNTAGTVVYNTAHIGADPNAELNPVDLSRTTSTESYWEVISGSVWAGSMNFMFRWSATENMVVDLSGSSVKAAFAALDGLFSLNGGIMPSMLWDFVDSLQMSVTFKF